MVRKRASHCLVARSNFLFALGDDTGINCCSPCSHTEMFNGYSWSPFKSMLQARSNFAALVLHDKIYAIAGICSTAKMNVSGTVEVYAFGEEE